MEDKNHRVDSKEEVQSGRIAPLRKEINDSDDRDQKDSSEDWDAENSRTGRHK
ncbi:hypothetical protein [Flavobacterium silvaticum]|uniref:Uncharacterized protein n=1 Tax=Flavobacterium silvaticum TaxID=1852020 RepID=A0A972FQ62_9FLAO|nr:hypothetical protein [Flavobacterium silvaticum]NMH27364.1 hypothetical protein [Flavobacterium silvaticum]